MRIDDRIYGGATLEEPVLSALLEAPTVRRLEKVLQHGVSGLIGLRRPTTRLEHSVGVLLLVRRFDAPLLEQVAALLHDVSHTAFSHVVDYVFDDHHGQAFHEEMKESFVEGTELPALLREFGIDWREILHEERFPLLERPAPALCADRVDYFLRDALDLGVLEAEEIGRILESLRSIEGKMVVADRRIARRMGEAYLAADEASWANFREVGLYELAARAIRIALDRGVISREELWGTDEKIWGKMKSSGDPELLRALELVSVDTLFVRDAEAPTFVVGTKLRTIDPPLLDGDRVRPLSEVDPEFGRMLEESHLRRRGPWPMRVIPPEI
jgi:hypothetical protein